MSEFLLEFFLVVALYLFAITSGAFHEEAKRTISPDEKKLSKQASLLGDALCLIVAIAILWL